MDNGNQEVESKAQASLMKTLRDFNDCVGSLKSAFNDTQLPIDDDNVTFHRMCGKLEFLLFFGMKERARLFSSRKNNPWHYFAICLGRSKSVHEGLHFLRNSDQLKTSTGKLRYFLRFCFVHNCLADTIQQCLTCEDTTNDYYSQNSLFGNSQLASQFVATLYEVSDIQFDLAPTGYDLDIGWPTFARKQFGHYQWKSQQPSSLRSTSSWLFSSSETQSVHSFSGSLVSAHRPMNSSMTSNASDTASQSADQDEHRDEVDEDPATIDDHLLLKVTQLSEEKGFLEQKIESLTRQLEQERQEAADQKYQWDRQQEDHEQSSTKLLERVAELEKQLAVCGEQQQSASDEKAKDLNTKLEDKERQVQSLSEHVDALKNQCATQELQLEQHVQAYEKQQETLKSALDRLADGERLTSSLQRELQSLSHQRQDEKDSTDAQLRHLQLTLTARSEECQGFASELQSKMTELDELRAIRVNLEEQLILAQSSNAELEAQLEELRDESNQLRNRIVELISEKDNLWQQSDRLLYLQRVHAQDKWTPDERVQECQNCRLPFSIFNRRHHCRSCGRIFCHACSDNWMDIAASCRRARTCDECFVLHGQFSSCADSSQLLLANPDQGGEDNDGMMCDHDTAASNEEEPRAAPTHDAN